MTLSRRKVSSAPGFLILVLACAPQAPPLVAAPEAAAPTVIYLVRHAEKGSGDDPSLTPAGQARALELARVLADAGIDAAYATQFLRTQETARPVAEAAGIEVTVDAADTGNMQAYVTGFARQLLDRHPGEQVLVAGHSNTVPRILEALGVASAPQLDDPDYDDLFVVTRTSGQDGPAALIWLHYGVPSP